MSAVLDSPEVWLPALNAALIVISGVFLVVGYVFIRRGQVQYHRRCMLGASVFATLFLVVYVTRAVLLPTRFFPGQGAIRTIYLGVLISHTIVAVLVAPLAFVTLRRALAGRFPQHRQIARVTLPMWVYTALTGWLVYMLLYGPWFS
jgi:putative membrane protein